MTGQMQRDINLPDKIFSMLRHFAQTLLPNSRLLVQSSVILKRSRMCLDTAASLHLKSYKQSISSVRLASTSSSRIGTGTAMDYSGSLQGSGDELDVDALASALHEKELPQRSESNDDACLEPPVGIKPTPVVSPTATEEITDKTDSKPASDKPQSAETAPVKVVHVTVPELSGASNDAVMGKWNYAVNDAVKKNAVVALVEMEMKSDVELVNLAVESPVDGVLVKQYAQTNDDVRVGDTLFDVEPLNQKNLEEAAREQELI